MTDNDQAREALKPCPFCGSDAQISGEEGNCFVACTSVECFAAVGEAYDRDAMPDHCFPDDETAIEAWNRRAPLQHEAIPVPSILHKTPVLTGMTFLTDVIINGVPIPAGTKVDFAVPAAPMPAQIKDE